VVTLQAVWESQRRRRRPRI